MNDLQRTDDWYLTRKGKLTASEIYILLANHKEDMTEAELEQFKKDNPKSRVRTKEVPFSQGTFSYLDGKIAEQFMPNDAFLEYMEDCSPRSRAMDWGTLMEDSARVRYQETKFLMLRLFRSKDLKSSQVAPPMVSYVLRES